MNRTELEVYFKDLFFSDQEQKTTERMSLFRLLDGELFYRMELWPAKMKMMFWKKPLSDRETFQVILFLFGNGCPLDLAQKWILSSTCWALEWQAKTRLFQVLSLYSSLAGDENKSKWYFFDLETRNYHYLSGERV